MSEIDKAASEPTTIKDLCQAFNITCEVIFKGFEREESKPKESYERPSVFYRSTYMVSISNRCNGKKEDFGYFMGHSSESEFSRMSDGEKHQRRRERFPKLNEVLCSLAQDASFFVNNDALYATYENFAEEYGYDSDSRKGFEIFQACQENGNRLLNLLGKEAFDRLMRLVSEGIEE
jgi:hypothetical protein